MTCHIYNVGRYLPIQVHDIHIHKCSDEASFRVTLDLFGVMTHLIFSFILL